MPSFIEYISRLIGYIPRLIEHALCQPRLALTNALLHATFKEIFVKLTGLYCADKYERDRFQVREKKINTNFKINANCNISYWVYCMHICMVSNIFVQKHLANFIYSMPVLVQLYL